MTWEIKQSINFYLEEFQPPKIPKDLRYLLMGAAIHACLAVILMVGLVINLFWQEHRLKGITERQSVIEQQVANIERERPPLKQDEGLVNQRADLRSDLESSQRILHYLTQQELDSSISFTDMVFQLGEQDVNGVWLKSFAFYEEGSHINIEGYTDDPAKISRYVSELLARTEFRKRAFRHVDVRKEEDSRWLVFNLDSRPAEKGQQDTRPASAKMTSADLIKRAREGML